MSYATVTAHRSMALDRRRNAAYRAALGAVVGPGTVVLDLGAGMGVHGLMAARLGARRVYLVEPEDVLSVAREAVRENGLDGVVECIRGRIQDVTLPEPVDVIVSALTGNFLVTEDLLDTLGWARDRLLAPGGTLVPSAGVMEAVPVSAPDLHAKEIAAWSIPGDDVDLSVGRRYAANTIFYRGKELGDAEWLADPAVLHAIDFEHDGYTGVQSLVKHEIRASGVCHGWVGWFRMKLGDRWLSTSPREPPMHWTPAFLPLDPPIPLEKGEVVSFGLDRAPFGDWVWRVDTGRASQEHATLFSAPLSRDVLARAALDHRPVPTGEGRAVMDVLAAADGATTVAAIAESLHVRYGGRFTSPAETLRFVQRVVRRYT